MLNSERIYLRPMEKYDADKIVEWRNNPEIRKGLLSYNFINKDRHLEWYVNNNSNKERIDLMVCLRGKNYPVGTVNFSSIDFKNRKAEYGILIDKTEWGNGYGKEASKLMFYYGFYELNFNKIYLRVLADNLPAIELYKKLGFLKDGLLRQDIYKKGRYIDVIVMSLLKKDWVGSNDN